jgi:hypothetical protein
MKPDEKGSKKYERAGSLIWLPRKMITLHGSDNMSEFVLHELSRKQCFDFQKAAYLVDNPDFNCVRGVAGVCQLEAAPWDNIWQKPEEFSMHMQQSAFNKKVRSLVRASAKKVNIEADRELALDVGRELGMGNVEYCSWIGKNDNHGILIFERNSHGDDIDNEDLMNGASLLSFCPIY